jgi:hypothetical protein
MTDRGARRGRAAVIARHITDVAPPITTVRRNVPGPISHERLH